MLNMGIKKNVSTLPSEPVRSKRTIIIMPNRSICRNCALSWAGSNTARIRPPSRGGVKGNYYVDNHVGVMILCLGRLWDGGLSVLYQKLAMYKPHNNAVLPSIEFAQSTKSTKSADESAPPSRLRHILQPPGRRRARDDAVQ